MIDHEDLYRDFIVSHAVSPGKPTNSYLSRLRRASKVLTLRISPKVLRTAADIDCLSKALSGRRVPPTAVLDIRAAMKKYVAMVAKHGL